MHGCTLAPLNIQFRFQSPVQKIGPLQGSRGWSSLAAALVGGGRSTCSHLRKVHYLPHSPIIIQKIREAKLIIFSIIFDAHLVN
jgi:hypothetical protein